MDSIKFISLILLFLFSTSISFAKTSLKDLLNEIRLISKQNSGYHYFDFDVQDEKIKLKQKITIDSCQIELNTFHPEYGHMFRDSFNLLRQTPFKKVRKVKGAYGLTFGLKPTLKGRTAIYYNTKDELKKTHKELSKLRKLCKTRLARKYFNKKLKVSKLGPVIFDGNLPIGKSYTDGRVLKVGNHKMAVLDGPRSFIERYRSVMNAKNSIYVQSLILRGDEAGKFLTDLLIQKKAEGLDVKMILDGLGSGAMDKPQTKTDRKNSAIMLNNLQAAGIKVYGYSCQFNILNELKGVDLPQILSRNHEKLWIVDGDGNKPIPTSKVIMGGINIAQEYFVLTGSSDRSWRDQDVGIKGPIVNRIAKDFLSTYIHKKISFKTHSSDKKCLNPFHPLKEKEKYLEFKKKKTKKYVSFKNFGEKADVKKMRKNIQKLINGESSLDDEISVRPIVYYPLKGIRFILARPKEGENYAYHAYVDLVKKAKKTIDIHQALLVPPPEFKQALIDAAKRGVKIRVISRTPETNEFAPITIVGRRHYFDIYNFLGSDKNCNEQGYSCPEFWEWAGNKEGEKNIILQTTHAKFMVVDNQLGIIGSHNMDYSSMNNAETVVLFDGKRVADELTQLFNEDLKLTRKASPEQLFQYADPDNKKEKLLLKTFMIIEKFL